MNFYDGFLGHDLGPDFNSRGHRCKEIEEINLHNYILFAGDNIAVGWDKSIEETYPYICSKTLNVDYYNLSIFNGGVESVKFNLLTWINKISKKPKAVIISCEFLNSFIVSDQNNLSFNNCDLDNDIIKDVLDSGNYTGFFNMRNLLAEKLLKNSVICPIFQIEFNKKITLFNSNVVNILHSNDMFDHKQIANTLVTEIRKTTEKVRP
jgi:hypothetical protein